MCGSPSKARMPESLARAPPGPVPPAVVHTPGGLALRLCSPGPGRGLGGPWASRRPVPARPPRGSPLTGTRSPRRRGPHGRPAPPLTAAGNPLTPKRKCGPRLSDPQPAAPLAAPRAVRQSPPGQSALGPQAAPGVGPCPSRSPDCFSLGPIGVRLTRGNGGTPSLSSLGEGGFMQILELEGRGGRRKGCLFGYVCPQ